MTAKAFNMRDVYRYSAKFLLYVTVPAGCAYYLKEDNWFIKTYRDMIAEDRRVAANDVPMLRKKMDERGLEERLRDMEERLAERKRVKELEEGKVVAKEMAKDGGS